MTKGMTNILQILIPKIVLAGQGGKPHGIFRSGAVLHFNFWGLRRKEASRNSHFFSVSGPSERIFGCAGLFFAPPKSEGKKWGSLQAGPGAVGLESIHRPGGAPGNHQSTAKAQRPWLCMPGSLPKKAFCGVNVSEEYRFVFIMANFPAALGTPWPGRDVAIVRPTLLLTPKEPAHRHYCLCWLSKQRNFHRENNEGKVVRNEEAKSFRKIWQRQHSQ